MRLEIVYSALTISTSLVCRLLSSGISVIETLSIQFFSHEFALFLNAQKGLSAYSASVKQTYVVYQRK
jgi:hypothetical protein